MPDDDAVLDPVVGEVVSEAFDGPGDWLPPAEAARRVGVSERTLWRRVNAGQYQRRLTAGKAEILVPVAGSLPNETGMALPVAPDALSVAIIEELRRQYDESAERLTRQAERLEAQAGEIGKLTAERDQLQRRLDDLARRKWWKWW